MSGIAAAEAVNRVAERAARLSYGKLLAILASRSRDVASAEDALAEAFRSALQTWPVRGIPDNPAAWLLTTARRELGHRHRHRQVADRVKDALAMIVLAMNDAESTMIPDERLKLMFVCAHPAIDAAVQSPLMLQTVLGLDAARIAACFLASPATMGQRLVRAKTKIRDAGLAFREPDADELPARLDAVLAAIYAAYGTGWDDVNGADPARKGLREEAIWLARVAVELLPGAAEAWGLLALLLHCEARHSARRSAEGAFIPLGQQDVALWSEHMIDEAERAVQRAAALGQPGRFQIEAAIQSVHAARRVQGHTNWAALLALYDYLVSLSPTLGVKVSRAAVWIEAGYPQEALGILGGLEESSRTYQPFWAAKGHAHLRLGNIEEARLALEMAAGLSDDEAVRSYLLGLTP
jgi:RNA polymerase sigma-70 factor, ECF subfamily